MHHNTALQCGEQLTSQEGCNALNHTTLDRSQSLFYFVPQEKQARLHHTNALHCCAELHIHHHRWPAMLRTTALNLFLCRLEMEKAWKYLHVFPSLMQTSSVGGMYWIKKNCTTHCVHLGEHSAQCNKTEPTYSPPQHCAWMQHSTEAGNTGNTENTHKTLTDSAHS